MSSYCVIDGCERPIRARGWCVNHYNRWQRIGDPGDAIFGLPANLTKGPDHPRWVFEGATYSLVHARIRRVKGSASANSCSMCSKTAAHWAYDHTDPDELIDERGRPYSQDPNRYMPLCVSCHKRFDMSRRQT